MHSFIAARGVTFELPNGRTLFEDIHFSLNAKITALVGPNGIGKSTLAKLIAGELEPSAGQLLRRATVSYLSQRENPPQQSVDDYLSTRYSWSILGEELLAGINRRNLCNQLSGGQWMRVRLAAIIHDQYLILDEPTNNLDQDARQVLQNFLIQYRHGVLLISHDRKLLSLCDEVLELSIQGLEKYGGGWSHYEELKAKERAQAQKNLEQAKNEREKAQSYRLEQLQKQERRNRRGQDMALKGGLPKLILGARKRQAQMTTGRIDASTLTRAQEKVGEAYQAFQSLKLDPQMYADLSGEAVPPQKVIAQAIDFNVWFEEWLYTEPLNFTWRGDTRIAIKGPNGSGKSTLVKAWLGESFITKGELKKCSLPYLYVDQHCEQLKDQMTILENVQEVSKFEVSEIRNNLAKLLFHGESVHQKVGLLSGGERLRAALACGLMCEQKPQVLILDEPTNNLDLANIEFLENWVSRFCGAIIIISHDEKFIEKCGAKTELKL